MKKLDVWNMALGMLGVAPVSGEDDGEVGRILGGMWRAAVDYAVMRLRPGWAMRVVRLKGCGCGGDGMGGMRWRAELPGDVVVVAAAEPGMWQVFDGVVYWRDMGELTVRFYERPSDRVDWDAMSGEVCAAKLAELSCMGVTGRADLRMGIVQDLQGRLLPAAQYELRLMDQGRVSDFNDEGRVLM